MADFEHLYVDRVGTDDRIARITLNRPEKLNALSQELLYEFNEALHDLEADHTARPRASSSCAAKAVHSAPATTSPRPGAAPRPWSARTAAPTTRGAAC